MPTCKLWWSHSNKVIRKKSLSSLHDGTAILVKKQSKTKHQQQTKKNRKYNANHIYNGIGKKRFFSTISCRLVKKILKDTPAFSSCPCPLFSPSLPCSVPMSFFLLLLEQCQAPAQPGWLATINPDSKCSDGLEIRD